MVQVILSTGTNMRALPATEPASWTLEVVRQQPRGSSTITGVIITYNEIARVSFYGTFDLIEQGEIGNPDYHLSYGGTIGVAEFDTFDPGTEI